MASKFLNLLTCRLRAGDGGGNVMGMISEWIFVVGLVIASGLGAAAVYFYLRGQSDALVERARAESSSELAALRATAEERKRRQEELSADVARLSQEITSLRQKIQSEGEARSAAEEKARQIPVLEERLRTSAEDLKHFQKTLSEITAQKSSIETALEKERKNADEKLALLEQAQEKWAVAFKALSADALKSNNTTFVDLAKQTFEKYQSEAKGDLEKRQVAIQQLILPVRESLEKVDTKIQQIEKDRAGAYEGLTQQVKSLLEMQGQLSAVTGNLAQALGTPRVRGRWGEIQLKRVVELAGMLNYCDFYEQQNVSTEEGALRPDLIVKLPGGKNIVVDAKAPLAAYLESMELEQEDLRRAKLKQHAQQIRTHIAQLSRKAYWEQFQPTPEFVVLFLPNETFFSAALQEDPSLIESAVTDKVILATPTTLITLLKAVSYGWRQEAMAENARQIATLGQDLYKRVSDMADHFADVGRQLGRAVESYNKSVGTLESRVLVTARKFPELHIGDAHSEIKILPPIETTPRALTAEELQKPLELE